MCCSSSIVVQTALAGLITPGTPTAEVPIVECFTQSRRHDRYRQHRGRSCAHWLGALIQILPTFLNYSAPPLTCCSARSREHRASHAVSVVESWKLTQVISTVLTRERHQRRGARGWKSRERAVCVIEREILQLQASCMYNDIIADSSAPNRSPSTKPFTIRTHVEKTRAISRVETTPMRHITHVAPLGRPSILPRTRGRAAAISRHATTTLGKSLTTSLTPCSEVGR